jgi:alkylation response protein AidB-like acyl-CoA dehydrogenase
MDGTSFEFTEQQHNLRKKGRELGEEWKPHARHWDETGKAPYKDLVKRAGEYGLLGLTMPAEYGGQDCTALDYTLCIEELCRASLSGIAAMILFGTTAAGPTICLAAEHEEVRRRFIPPVVRGERSCAMAITEPKHGSAITDLETSAVPDGDHFVINGTKRFITGATFDDLYVTFVRFGNIPGSKGIGAIMVERGTLGFRMEEGPALIGFRGIPHGYLFFENCRVPKENLILSEGKFAHLMGAFNMERLHNLVISLGLAEGAHDEAFKYIRERVQFGRPIWEFQAIYHQLAEMWTQIEAGRYLTYMAAATAVDGKYPKALEVSTAKLFANEMALNVTWLALKMHGGDGTSLAYPVQRAHRDSQICAFGGGTAEILKNVIASQLLGERLDQHRR